GDEVRSVDLRHRRRVGEPVRGGAGGDLQGVLRALRGAGRLRRRRARGGGDGDDGSRARRRDADHRRAVRGDEGSARRPLSARSRQPRRGDRVRRPHPRRTLRLGRGQAAGGALTEEIFREEWGRVVASLTGFLGDLDRAEEAAQEAFAVAAERWPRDGVPANPGAWLVTTARNRAINRIRRDRTLAAKTRLLQVPEEAQDSMNATTFPDERLELIFTCCHPALATEAQVALTMRTLGGLTTGEFGRAFLF